jgi:hypothetical protein
MDMMMDEALGCFDPRLPRRDWPQRPEAWGRTRGAMALASARSRSLAARRAIGKE